MSHRGCVSCGGRIVQQAREAAVRHWARLLSSPSCYPVVYRLVDGLSLCAGCLEALPVIGDRICIQCGREHGADSVPVPAHTPISAVGELCQDCRLVADEPLQGNRSLLRYNEWGKSMLGLYKYRGDERLANFYATLLAIAVYRYHDKGQLDCITTVPLHSRRLRERGFNQVDLLAGRLSKAIGVRARSLLVRTKETAKLSQQSGRTSRQESMRGAFSWAGENVMQDGDASRTSAFTILLLDDIYTTGSTLRSCATTIREHVGPHCQIYSLTIYR
jgi:competence protein ComFC